MLFGICINYGEVTSNGIIPEHYRMPVTLPGIPAKR
jgi:hypothetical protein